MNRPDLSPFAEITFGPAFHVQPLRGKSFALTNPHFTGPLQIRITLAPAASEFDDHFLGFATMEPVGPYLDFRDAAGDLLYTLAPAE
jgi:hypothetical protein